MYACVSERQFLGYRLIEGGKLVIASHSIERLQDKIRRMTKRNRGVSLEVVITELNKTLRGWINSFQLTQWPSQLKRLDEWIHRKLRCYRLKQRKRTWPIAKFLISLGVPAQSAWALAKSGKGWWRLSMSVPVHHAMTNAWFKEQALISLLQKIALVKV